MQPFITHTINSIDYLRFILEKGYIVSYSRNYFGTSLFGSYALNLRYKYATLIFPLNVIYKTEHVPVIYVGNEEHKLLQINSKLVDIGIHSLMWEAEIRVRKLLLKDAIGLVIHHPKVSELAEKISQKYNVPILSRIPVTQFADSLYLFTELINFLSPTGWVGNYLKNHMTKYDENLFWKIIHDTLPPHDKLWFYNSRIIRELKKTFGRTHPELISNILKVRNLLLNITFNYHNFVFKLFGLHPIKTLEHLLNCYYHGYDWLISYSITSELFKMFKRRKR